MSAGRKKLMIVLSLVLMWVGVLVYVVVPKVSSGHLAENDGHFPEGASDIHFLVRETLGSKHWAAEFRISEEDFVVVAEGRGWKLSEVGESREFVVGVEVSDPAVRVIGDGLVHESDGELAVFDRAVGRATIRLGSGG